MPQAGTSRRESCLGLEHREAQPSAAEPRAHEATYLPECQEKQATVCILPLVVERVTGLTKAQTGGDVVAHNMVVRVKVVMLDLQSVLTTTPRRTTN